MTNIPPPVLEATPFRWVVGMVVLVALAMMLLRAAVSQGIVGQTLMSAAAVAALALAWTMLRARGQTLHWQQAGLCDGNGRVIAAREQIIAVDRGALALKPSNGFTLRLRDPQPRQWSPGLWWRFGRRVGVGGLASPGVAKALADRIALDTAQAG